MKRNAYLLRRNLSLFFQNKLILLLSAASIFIILCIYVVFLRDFLLDTVAAFHVPDGIVHEFTDRFMLSGLLTVVGTTTCFGMMQICVTDRALGKDRDYRIAPLSPFAPISGYWASTCLISFLFTVLTFTGCEAFFYFQYGRILSFSSLMEAMVCLGVSSLFHSGLLLCFARELRSTSTFATFANLYGTLIGFLAGTYLPYYFYPKTVRSVLFYFPPTQLTSLMRRICVSPLESDLLAAFPENQMDSLFRQFGIHLVQKGNAISFSHQWLLIGSALFLLWIYLWASSYWKTKGT